MTTENEPRTRVVTKSEVQHFMFTSNEEIAIGALVLGKINQLYSSDRRGIRISGTFPISSIFFQFENIDFDLYDIRDLQLILDINTRLLGSLARYCSAVNLDPTIAIKIQAKIAELQKKDQGGSVR